MAKPCQESNHRAILLPQPANQGQIRRISPENYRHLEASSVHQLLCVGYKEIVAEIANKC